MNKVANELLKIAKELTGASTHAQASGVIKKLLKKAFPRTKFRVRSDSFAGGNSVDIDWVDGPTRARVEELVKKYQYGRFDGMQDLYESNNVDRSLPQVKYVQAQRDISPATKEHIKAEIAKKFGIDMNDDASVRDKFNAWPSDLIYREFSKNSY
jgi:hypothetical protein